MRRHFMNAHKEQLAKDYMTIEPLEDGLTISLNTFDLEYNKGDGWNILTRKSVLTLNRGELCSFRANLLEPLGHFQIQKSFNLKGNCLSLIFGDKAAQNINSRLPERIFSNLFYGTGVVEVDKHFLPSMSLSSRCYEGMFYDCDLLTVAPELPATQVKYSCYSYMFNGADSLLSAPRLPATILTDNCYYCMFNRCNTLNHIEMMATDISAASCLYKWVSGVAPTGTFVKNPEATWDVVGVNGVPEGWTVKFDGEEDSGIELPIRLYFDRVNDNAEAIISYIKSLDSDGDEYIGGMDEIDTKSIMHFNDTMYPQYIWIEEDCIGGGSCTFIDTGSLNFDILQWRFYSDGTFKIDWD